MDSDQDPVWFQDKNEQDATGTLLGDIGIPDGNPVVASIVLGGVEVVPTVDSLTVNYGAQTSTTGWNTGGAAYTWYDSVTSSTEWGTYGEGYNTTDGPWTHSSGIGSFSVTYCGAGLGPDGTIAEKGDTDQSRPDHIHISVTDGSDGAIETANYYMRIHRGTEILPSNRPATLDVPKILNVTVLGAGYAVTGGDVPFTYEQVNAGWGIAKNSCTLLQTLSSGWIKLALAANGITITSITPTNVPMSADFAVDWTSPHSTFPPEWRMAGAIQWITSA